MYEADGGAEDSCSLFLARLPARLERAQLLAVAERLGRVENLTFNGRRRYAFVKYCRCLPPPPVAS